MSYSFPLGFSGMHGDFSVAQTSAGSDESDAAALVADFVMLSTVGSGEGVLLPALQPKETVIVINGAAANALLVYPTSGAAINGGATDGALSLPARHGAMFMGASATVVFAVYG